MSKFQDLGPRIISAIVLAVLGLGALISGGLAFLIFAAAIGGIMIWELCRMLDVAALISVLLGVLAGLSIYAQGMNLFPFSEYALALAPLAGMAFVMRDKWLLALYGLAIMAAVVTLVDIRENAGPTWALWLILVVIASDIGGYFFGRIIGGPKILPVISPKKTWSGTIGGWLLAALVGWLMMDALLQGSTLIVLSVFGAMAGQLGDIVESRIKRHAGVKDSSNLIPGHGGFLDRFDALLGAALMFLLWTTVMGAL